MAKLVYVKGTVRKDAVAILTKDCRVTEARVLETLYKDAWVPQELRLVEVEGETTPQSEAERLITLYGPEAFEDAYGKPGQARQALAEVLALDTPAKVKASGLLLENEGTPVTVAPDRKGTRAAASAGSGEPAQAAL